MNFLFDNVIETLQKTLNVRARKHEVTISNIANADTPNYKAVELRVEKELSEENSSANSDDIVRTHPRHLSVNSYGINYMRPEKIDLSKEITLRGDGNTVNIEKEMAELAENNLMYRASANILSRKFQGLLKAIQGGRG